MVAASSGVYTCMGCNDNCEMEQVRMFVTSLPGGFRVEGPTQAVEGDTVDLVCGASKYNYTGDSLAWYKQVGQQYVEVKNIGRGESGAEIFDVSPSQFDVGKRLTFDSVAPGDSGVYACRARRLGDTIIGSGTIIERQMELTVRKMEIPQFVDTFNMNNDVMYINEDGSTVEMKCLVEGVPKPTVTWYLNNTAIDFASDINYQSFDDGQSLRIATVVAKKNEGTYTCKASSRAGVAHLEQTIVKVESPKIYETNMLGSHQIIDTDIRLELEPGQSLNLTCKARGNPRPVLTWMLDNKLVTGTRAVMADNRQTLMVTELGPGDSGRYECVASNIGGSVTRHQEVRVTPVSGPPGSVYSSQLAIPIYIGVGVALLISVIVLVLVRFCCHRSIKSPATPPTPRLTQYEQPEDTESCRLTGPGARDTGSVSPGPCHSAHYAPQCSACHYTGSYTGLYGYGPGPGAVSEPDSGIPATIMGSSLIGVRSCYSPGPGYAPAHSPTPLSLPSPAPGIPSPMSDFTAYSHYGPAHHTATLPYRMETLNREISKRLQERQNESSPPLTAEF